MGFVWVCSITASKTADEYDMYDLLWLHGFWETRWIPQDALIQGPASSELFLNVTVKGLKGLGSSAVLFCVPESLGWMVLAASALLRLKVRQYLSWKLGNFRCVSMSLY